MPLAHYLSRLREERRPLRFLLSRLLWKSGLGHRLGLRIACGGYRLHFFPTNLSACYWLDPGVRVHDERRLRALLGPGGVMVDVGANIGALALYSSTLVGDTGRVFAIEAHPTSFGYLTRNVQLNGFRNLRLFNAAIGSEEGTVTFTDGPLDDQNAVTREPGLRVRCTTLDTLLAGEPSRVDLLKVDVEGFEKFVFEGAPEVLGRTECILFESWEQHAARYGYSSREVIALLARHGFTSCKLQDGVPVPLPPGYVSHQLEDLIAARDVAALARKLAAPSDPSPGLSPAVGEGKQRIA